MRNGISDYPADRRVASHWVTAVIFVQRGVRQLSGSGHPSDVYIGGGHPIKISVLKDNYQERIYKLMSWLRAFSNLYESLSSAPKIHNDCYKTDLQNPRILERIDALLKTSLKCFPPYQEEFNYIRNPTLTLCCKMRDLLLVRNCVSWLVQSLSTSKTLNELLQAKSPMLMASRKPLAIYLFR